MVELKKPTIEFIGSYLGFIEEMRQHGETIWESMIPRAGENSSDFLRRILRGESTLEPAMVPATTYWAVINSGVVGRIALRHHLNADLSNFGGHIGYEVRPSARRQGVAKEMLRLLLATPKAKEIGKLLLTCSPTNVASNKTIVANGGVLEKTIWVERIQRDTNLYWISLEC